MKDRIGRNIDYMRISITDRCNLRCRYCMPQDIETTAMTQILTYEEIEKVVSEAVQLGITHYRVTGGEPLVRKNCVELIQRIKEIDGVKTVGMTTNGVLLENNARALKQAGLDSINVSLDTMDAGEFEILTGKRELDQVLRGIDAARHAGIPVKINAVNQKGLNWQPLLDFAVKQGIIVRFIEMMPIGYGKTYPGNSNESLLREIEKKYGAGKAIKPKYGNGPAVYYHFEQIGTEIGFISAIHHKFCENCNRIRLSAEGYLKLCLCYENGIDLRSILRNPGSQNQLKKVMEESIFQKPSEHCFDEIDEITEANAMIQIGG